MDWGRRLGILKVISPHSRPSRELVMGHCIQGHTRMNERTTNRDTRREKKTYRCMKLHMWAWCNYRERCAGEQTCMKEWAKRRPENSQEPWCSTCDGITPMSCSDKLCCADSLLKISEFITPNLVIKDCEFACTSLRVLVTPGLFSDYKSNSQESPSHHQPPLKTPNQFYGGDYCSQHRIRTASYTFFTSPRQICIFCISQLEFFFLIYL